MPPEHRFEIVVSDRYVDRFGHVNNAAYMTLFELARWDWITGNGFGAQEIDARGIGPVVLEASLRYQREVKANDRVTILTKTLEYRGRIGRIEQVMFGADGRPACTAMFSYGLFDLKARKLIKPTPEWLKAVGLDPAQPKR